VLYTHRPNHRQAFSLIELAVVLIIIAIVAAIAIPTFQAVIDRSDYRAHQARDEALARRIGAGIAFQTQPTYAEIVDEALAETDVSTSAPGLAAQSNNTPTGWNPTVNYIPTPDPSDPANEANWVSLAAGQNPDGNRWTTDRNQLAWTVDDIALRTATRHDETRMVYCTVQLSNGLGTCTANGSSSSSSPTPGFPLTVTAELDAALDLSWPTQEPAAEYRVNCWTPALTPAGDTPKIVTATSGATQTAQVTGLENFVTHTCEVDAIVAPADVTSSPATGVPFTGPTLPAPPGGPPSAPPVGPEVDPPSTPAPPTPPECAADGSNTDCLGTGTALAGLTSFVSAHGGTHQLYTVDTSTNRLRVVVDTGSAQASTRTISVLDATGVPVDLSTATDLVAGRHPSRVHPQGTSPYSVLYASTSTGGIWMLSPISGSSTWRGYQVATGLGAVSALAYDNCPAGPATSTRAQDSMCVHAATATGIIPVPMTNSTAPVIETALPARGPAAAAGLASNTADALATANDGAYFTTSGASVTRTNWDGSVNTLTNSGTAMSGANGIAWMDDEFYVADSTSKRVFNVTAAGVRSVVAGIASSTVMTDGIGTAASFVNPTRIHWHGSTPDLYVLDANCVRRLDADTGAVTTLLCPASTPASAPLLRADSTAAAPVYAPSTAASSTAASSAPRIRLSDDGVYAVFVSNQANLTADDATTDWDVFRRRLTDGDIILLTNGANGAPTSADSLTEVPVSDDGSVVAYTSAGDLYHQVVNGSTTQVATRSFFGLTNNLNAEDLSSDGTTLLLRASKDLLPVDATGTGNAIGALRGNDDDIYAWTAAGGFTFVSSRADNTPANSAAGFGCTNARYSPDETRVSMNCTTSLVTPDGNGTVSDVFVKDLAAGTVWRANESSANVQSTLAASVAGMLDADQVVFVSADTALVPADTNAVADVFIKRLSTGATTRITYNGAELTSGVQSASANDQGVLVVTAAALDPADVNALTDVHLYRPDSGTWRWLSAAPGGGGGWLNASATISNLDLTSSTLSYMAHHSSSGGRRYLVLRSLT
jgi:prepilin-type N-terminal cleavage/methylation domain-containing protein